MRDILYNIVLVMWAVCLLPRIFYQYVFQKKYRGNLLSRLGFRFPKIAHAEGRKRIWIHATSLGETKAVKPFIDQIRKDYPDALLIFSSTTETGQTEAKKSDNCIDVFFFLPLDFSWLMRKLVKVLQPDLFVLVESDFWYNLLRELKNAGVKTALVNGRVSLNSFKRYKRAPRFSKKLFSSIDLYCVQTEAYKERFEALGALSYQVFVTGNLKFDVKKFFKPENGWNFPKNRELITVASTHEKEEEMIIDALKSMDPSVVFLLAPRHPERFDRVANLLRDKGIIFRRIREDSIEGERVILIDTIGLLDECFSRSKLAIIGGSFVSHIGGHNVYEPVKYQIPVIYGPYMQNQESLVEILEKYGIGKKVELSDLYNVVSRSLREVSKGSSFKKIQNSVEGATIRSWEKIKEL